MMQRTNLLVAGKPFGLLMGALLIGTVGLGSANATPGPTDIILDHTNTCGTSTTACYGAATPPGNDGINPNVNDVIGERKDFDVKSIQFTTWTNNHIVGDILFNFNYLVNQNNPTPSLADWTDFGFVMRVGDLLFNAGGLDFGVALNSHDGLIAGDLYQVGSFKTSDQFGLNNSQVIWRDNFWSVYFGGNNPTPPVRMNEAGAQLLGAGTVAVSHFDEGLFAAGVELKAHLDFNPGGENGNFWQTYLLNGGLDTSFAAAICANDIIEGHVTPAVPEPSTWLLFGSGLAGLVVWRRKGTASAKA
jgi:hypothetical protein